MIGDREWPWRGSRRTDDPPRQRLPRVVEEVPSGVACSYRLHRSAERGSAPSRAGGTRRGHIRRRFRGRGGQHGHELEEGQGGVLRRRRPAPGHRRAVRRSRPDADDGLVPEERHVGPGQRPADPGAAEHRRRLVHPGDRRLAGRPRLDEQHVPHQRPAVRQPHGRVRRRRAPGRVDRPVGRARRAQGRPGRVGRRPQRHDQRPDHRLPGVLLRPRRDDQLHRHGRRTPSSTIRPSSRPSGCSSTTRPATPARRRSRAPRRRRRPAGRDRAAVVQPAPGDAHAGARLRHRQVRPERLHLRQHQRQHGRTTTGCCSRARRTQPTRSASCRKGQWADVKVKIVGGALGRARPPACSSRSRSCTGDLSRVRLFHTSVSRAIASLADVARRARLHR